MEVSIPMNVQTAAGREVRLPAGGRFFVPDALIVCIIGDCIHSREFSCRHSLRPIFPRIAV
jgi:hypothetical protein